jgi:tRNA dimethylallyltransferase
LYIWQIIYRFLNEFYLYCMNHNINFFSTHRPLLIVIAGPTAVGKTDFAVKMAKEIGTVIISADSRQFYKEMNIGTAKPTAEEIQGVKHHFIDFLSIEDQYNAYDFEKDVTLVLEKLFGIHQQVIMTGGSGLYVKAACDGIDIMPDIPNKVRQGLKNELKEKGLEALLQRLKIVDPDYFAEVDQQNPARVIRGLEIYETSGRPFSSFRTGGKAHRDFNIIKIGLERERQELYDRINRRVDLMIAKGLFFEVENLFEKRGLNALNTVGYKEIFDFMEGKYDREEAIRLLKRNSRRYAKRQMTWFKNDGEIKWFHPKQYEEAVAYVQGFCQ